jgi:hypothetical protein
MAISSKLIGPPTSGPKALGEAGQVHVPGARVGSTGVEQGERVTCAVDVPPGVDVAYLGVGAHAEAEGV